MDKLHFLPGLVMRSPLYSYVDYVPEKSAEIINDSDFRQAIYFASPAFYQVLAAKNFDPALLSAKEKLTIAKYYNRMCFRPTPFGTCSAFTLTGWGSDNSVQLEKNYKIHLQPDNEVAVIAGKYLFSDSKTASFYLNPTLYRQGQEFRYVRSLNEQKGTKLSFSLDSLEVTSLTSGVVNFASAAPRDFHQLIETITALSDCSFAEAEDALYSLINAQVLRPDTDYNISGKDYFIRLFENNKSAEDFAFILSPKAFSNAPATLAHIQQQANDIATLLKSQGKEAPEKLFYCNTERKTLSGTLDHQYRDTLIGAVNCLRLLVPTGQPAALKTFIKDFTRRFEGRKIPLMQALDPDHGIGYGDLSTGGVTPGLLAGIHFLPEKQATSEVQWSATHQLLMQKWLNTGPGKPIMLQQADLSALPPSKVPLPPSISIMFRVTEEGLQIEHAGGASALSLIGRFTPFSKEICNVSREIAEQEQKNNPGVIFAEIAQLSDNHIDNVNKRENIYSYEIPINSISIVCREQQLHPSELLVSVREGEIILESAKNGKRVIPRLSSAYNFNHNQLPLFRFLCELQYQGTRNNLQLDIQQLFPDMVYYPRVQFGDTILSPAIWHIKQEDIRGLKPEGLRCFCKAQNIPSLIAVAHTDQQLVFDLNNDAEALLFSQVTATMDRFTLREFFLPSSTAVRHENGQPMVNQFIASLINNDTVYKEYPSFPASVTANKTKRDFILGSGWLYLKIYCNPASANRILIKHVLPAVRDLATEAPIAWFFIRYADPKPHIRLRIKIAETNTGPVIALFKKRISGLVKESIVREYQADTYRRELDRYGADIINLVEDFFYASSELVCSYLRRQPGEDHEQYLAISSMSIMLNMALPNTKQQVDFLAAVKESLSREYGREKSVRVELDQKYREVKKIFMELGNGDFHFKKMKLSGAHHLFIQALGAVIRKAAKFDPIRRQSLLADLIHMHLNRTFSSQQRRQEFVLYYFFHKFTISETYANTKHLSVAAVHPG
jgi:thiopeptide-type bacteriocin biosynthesis protein